MPDDPYSKALSEHMRRHHPGLPCPRINFDCVGPGLKDVKYLSIKPEGHRPLYDDDHEAQLTLDFTISLDRNYPIEAGLFVVNLLEIKERVDG